jgi:diguanylate cyclase
MTGVYSPALIALSYVIAVLASYVALDLASRLTAASQRTAKYWLIGGACAMGTGIWSMHFIGMLALHLPIPMAFDLPITAASLLIAVTISGFALHTVTRPTLTRTALAMAATIMGMGIAGMHYTGMAAMQIYPGIRYDLPIVGVSVLIAICASSAALWLAFTLRSAAVSTVIWKRIGSAGVMGAAIVGMHFCGMAAAHFAPHTICTVPIDQINTLWLAGVIAGFCTLFLVATMLISVLDGALARELAAANRRILELALTDPLTGLANRRSFLDRLQFIFAGINRGGAPFSVLYFDLDHFKDVNDTLGHLAGDTLLREMAERVGSAIRETDVVARFGGDEFAILDTQATTPEASGALAAHVARAVAVPFSIRGTDVRVTASIGIASYDPDLTDPEDMLRRADRALYRAKADGGNCFRFHSADLDEKVQERVTIAEELRVAADRGELELYYQPQIDLGSRRIVGLEALMRWNHPTRGLLFPAAFIPVAEATGSISALGRWGFEDACRQRRVWEDQGLAPRVVSVNLSAAQFRGTSHVEQEVAASLAKWDIAPDAMELELTETVLMEATERYGAALGRLRQLGVRIAIDDFGTGYSSLSYLTRYPVNRLKIAQELLARVPTDPRSATVVRAAVRIGLELGIVVIAEGVETEAQASFLLATGCEQAQGYYFGRPVPARDATALLVLGAAAPTP